MKSKGHLVFILYYVICCIYYNPFDKIKKNIHTQPTGRTQNNRTITKKKRATKCKKVLSRKAENKSYQATIQTDCQNEPNSCKIQRPVPRLLKCHHCTVCVYWYFLWEAHKEQGEERMAGRDFKESFFFNVFNVSEDRRVNKSSSAREFFTFHTPRAGLKQ